VLADGEREAYEAAITLCKEGIAKFAEAARTLDFTGNVAEDIDCYKCEFLSVCRNVYNVGVAK
jgi:hypothetical protein